MRYRTHFVLLLVSVVLSTLFIASFRQSDGHWPPWQVAKQSPQQTGDIHAVDNTKRNVAAVIRGGDISVSDNSIPGDIKTNDSVDSNPIVINGLNEVDSNHGNASQVGRPHVKTITDNQTANIPPGDLNRARSLSNSGISDVVWRKADAAAPPRSAGSQTCQPMKSIQLMEKHFGKKFNASIDPFLSQGALLSRNMNKYPLPFGLRDDDFDYSKAMYDRIGDMGLPLSIPRLPCRRCIVIGNGGLLKNSKLGKEIDSYDVVIRMNQAPTEGYEVDVGSKTTLRMLYPESSILPKSEYIRKGWTLLVIPFKFADVKWAEYIMDGRDMKTLRGYWAPVALDIRKPKDEVRVLNPEITLEAAANLIGFKLGSGKLNKNVPTSGVMAILISMRICDEVSVAGFGYDMSKPMSLLHYYSSERVSKMKNSFTHDLTPERKMLRKLVEKDIIKDLTHGLR